jgi:ABC-type nitrate/sulfonate/bicarbonate transport system substrate-binding protein
MAREGKEQERLVLIARDIRPDAKKRVTLGKAMTGLDEDVRFDMYLNESGQILLDPQVSIPASEAWLYRNPEAIDAVRRGLQEAAEGKAAPAGSFASYADEE